MIRQLRSDILEAPEPFSFGGPEDREQCEHELSKAGHTTNPPLLEVWGEFGGGYLFETEELLSPLGEGWLSIVNRNAAFYKAGLPADYLVFHVGMHLSVVDRSGAMRSLDEANFKTIRTYAALDDWYADLRSEFAERYGLAGLAGETS